MRRGRKRKPGVKRQPDGRVKPQDIGATAEIVAHRAADLAAVTGHRPDAAIVARLPHEPKASNYIGMLCIGGLISQGKHDAAESYRATAEEFDRLLSGPKRPTALDINRIAGKQSVDVEAEARAFRRAKAAYERYHDALSIHGHGVVRAVTAALNNNPPNWGLLLIGLEALETVDRGNRASQGRRETRAMCQAT